MMDFFLRIKNFFLEHLQIIFEDEEEKENVEKIENNFEVLNLETEETDKIREKDNFKKIICSRTGNKIC